MFISFIGISAENGSSSVCCTYGPLRFGIPFSSCVVIMNVDTFKLECKIASIT